MHKKMVASHLTLIKNGPPQNDEELEKMITVLRSIWASENVSAMRWAIVQFRNAFPLDQLEYIMDYKE